MKDNIIVLNPDQISRIKQRQEECKGRSLSIKKEWQGRRGFQWLQKPIKEVK